MKDYFFTLLFTIGFCLLVGLILSTAGITPSVSDGTGVALLGFGALCITISARRALLHKEDSDG